MLTLILLPFYNFSQRRLRAGWRILIHLIVFALLLASLLIPATYLALAFRIDPDQELGLLFGGLLQSLALVLTVLLASYLLDRRKVASLGFARAWLPELSIGFALGAFAMLWIFAAETLLGWITIERVGSNPGVPIRALLLHQAGWFLLMLSVGVAEEMFSRGYHLKNLSEGFRGLGKWPAVIFAVVISSAFFGLLHAMNPNANWISNLGVALAGLMLATGRIATGSLAAPIGLHISWNFFQGPVLGFPVSGNQLTYSLVQITQGGDPLWTGGEFGPEAGLIGFIPCVALTAAFIAWGLAKSRPARYVAQLAHYHPPRRQHLS